MTREEVVPCITSCYDDVTEQHDVIIPVVSREVDDVLISFSDNMRTKSYDDDDGCDYDVMANSPKRYLYTICENNEPVSDTELEVEYLSDRLDKVHLSDTAVPVKPARPGFRLMRAREWANLEDCGMLEEDEEEDGDYLITQTNHVLTSRSCGTTSLSGETLLSLSRDREVLTRDPDEFIMFPDNRNITDDQKKGAMFRRLSTFTDTCDVAIQTTTPSSDYISTRPGECDNCDFLQEQIAELIEQLELADNEIGFLTDECRVLQEITDVQNREAQQRISQAHRRSQVKAKSDAEHAQSYLYWLVGCIVGFPKYIFKYWTWP